MKVSQAVEEYRYAILDRSPRTQYWNMEKLERFAVWCEQEQLELESLKAPHIRRYLESVKQRPNLNTGKPLSSHTVRGYAQVIKTFLNWCSQEDGYEELVSEKLPKRMEMPHVNVKVIETFTPDHIKRLFAASEKEFTPTLTMRDKAIVAVLIDTGIRVGELCDLTIDNVFLSPEDAFIKVKGKGRKEREVSLGKQARAALHRYITRYRHAPKNEQHVFLARNNEPLKTNGVLQLFKRLGEWGKVKGVRCSPHTARHTYAVNYLRAGGDVYVLSRLLGHASIGITETYLRAYKAKDARKGGLSVLDEME